MGVDLAGRVRLEHGFSEGGRYPAMFVNVTNRCNLSCAHCFVFREANPNEATSPRLEQSDEEMLATIEALRDRHGVVAMLWLGGEPLLRKRLVQRGVELFARNIVTTNGTLPLVDLGATTTYVVSLDGPPEINDAVRGAGTFERVMGNIAQIPAGFTSPVQVQCTVTATNQDHLEELVDILLPSRVAWMTFSFYVPSAGDGSGLGWPTPEDRMVAVDKVLELKRRHPAFVRNRTRALELMAPERAPAVTAACPARAFVLPLYLDGDSLVTPYCCYGNDVDCDNCGAWVVFHLAALGGA